MRFLFVTALIVLSFMSGTARAYRTLTDQPELADAGGAPVAWSQFPIAIEVFAQARDPIDAEETSLALERAIERWNAAMCTHEALEHAGAASGPIADGDGVNTVQWIHTGWSLLAEEDALAVTYSAYEEERYRLIEGDIYLNAAAVGWDGDLGEHLDGVLTHELGHLLGLAHPCEVEPADGVPLCEGPATSVMHPLYDPRQGAITEDDEAGACFLYPDGPVSESPAIDPESGCAVASVRGGPMPAFVLLLAVVCMLRLVSRARANRRLAAAR